jgi:prepilin peptidase CpaA
MNWDNFLLFDALALAVAAAVLDVQNHRIPNWLNCPGVAAGILLRSVFFGWKGLGSAVSGCVLAGGIVFLCYAVRAMGAGDVKLLAVIGSFVEPSRAVVVLLATAIFGGVLAIIYAIYTRRIGSTVRNVGSVLKFHSSSGMQVHPEINLDNPSALRMPYGLAIAAGTLYSFVGTWWR